MRVGWWAAIGVLMGCNGKGPGKDGTEPGPPQQGMMGMIRMPDGSPGVDVLSFVGGSSRTEPDSSGMVYHLDTLPGRLPVSAELEGFAPAYSATEVHPDHLSAARYDMAPFEVVDIPDPSQPTTIAGDGFTLTIPADSIEVDGEPWTEAWHLGWVKVTEDNKRSMPADLTGIRDDVDLVDIVIHHAIGLRGWTDKGRIVTGSDTVFDIAFDLPSDSPVLQSSYAKLYSYSNSRSYWSSGGNMDLDPKAGTAARVGFKSLTWLGVGLEDAERGCITGRVVGPDGGGLFGATVTLLQDGLVGVDRNDTLDGEFCVAMDVGATGTLEVIGARADRGELYTWSGAIDGPSNAGPCVSACTDVGTITVDVHTDADGDRYFTGPGGDCDDSDPDVNPNLALGDGRFCGDGS